MRSTQKSPSQETSLTKNDYDHLRRGYVTCELAIAAGLFRVDSHEGARLVGQLNRKNAPKKNCAGIVFPYRYPEDANVREVRLRRHPLDGCPNAKRLRTLARQRAGLGTVA